MKLDVVVATKGRVREVAVLLEMLAAQSVRPDRVVVVGASQGDIDGLEGMDIATRIGLRTLVSPIVGAASQRNVGIEALSSSAPAAGWVVAFFDDDFRPAANWVENALALFDGSPAIAGATGVVLADGALGRAISEQEAKALVSGAGGIAAAVKDVARLYGCNMAVRASDLADCRFDDGLPLYSWLEDADLSGQLRRKGRLVRSGALAGVHLGVQSARTSGTRYGYSQIANPIYLYRKGTLPVTVCIHFVTRALASNLIHSISRHPTVDYRGRLMGSLRASFDLFRGTMRPSNIVRLS